MSTAPAQRRRQRDRAAGLDDELEVAEGEGDRGGRLGVADRDAASRRRAQDAEGQRRHHQRLQRVADRRAGVVDGDDRAAGEAARDIVIAFGLDDDDRQPRAERERRSPARRRRSRRARGRR